jgi:hypothetical protein
MLYLRENTTKYKQDMLGYFAKSNLNIKQLKLDIAQQSGNKMDLENILLYFQANKALQSLVHFVMCEMNY